MGERTFRRPAGRSRRLARGAGGFTLIELLIVVVIVAVIASIAIPTYHDIVVRSRRSDATVALSEMANLQEKFYSSNFVYATVAAALPYPATSQDGYYTLSIPVVTTVPAYTLQAAAVGSQASDDPACAVITLSSTGIRSPSDCW